MPITTKVAHFCMPINNTEYPRSQEIAKVAHFPEYDGLVVPSARHACLNVIVFCGRILPDSITMQKDHSSVNWDE